MESLKIKTHVGDDGLLKINLPIVNRDLEVMIIYQPVIKTEKRQWSPDFFQRTCGSWEGEPLVREPQPEEQERDFLL